MPGTTTRTSAAGRRVAPTREQTDRFKWLVANTTWRSIPKIVDWVTRAVAKVKTRTMSREHMQWAIDHLAAVPLRGIPDGHYLLGDRRFKLRTPTDGKWAGRTSVYAVNDDGDGAPLRGQQRRAVLAALADTHFDAAQRFGQQTERCPYCNQQLDDPVSRRVGVGPNCAAARAIPWI